MISTRHIFLLALLALASCGQNDRTAPTSLHVQTNADPALEYGNLRIYPITADPALIAGNSDQATLKSLREGIRTPGFRISELKQFGRTKEVTFNALTVQNKGVDTVFLMSGDVVKGGNQDRVIAFDDIIPPGTIKNIEVFCVERGRWNFRDSTASHGEKSIFAFSGYYHVASPEVRHAVQRTGDQQAVWAAVAKVTSDNQAGSSTDAYTALDKENEFKTKRDAYLRFFEGKLTDRSDVVGMIAVCNGEVLGVDIFGHPNLFHRQFESLIHGYATHAATAVSTNIALTPEQVEDHFRQVARLSSSVPASGDSETRFARNGKWIHLYSK
jgi:hypothetical protein